MDYLKQKTSTIGNSPLQRLNRVSSVYFLLLAVVATGSVYFWQHSKVNELSSQTTNLKGQIVKLNDQVRSNNAQTKELQGDIDTLKAASSQANNSSQKTSVVAQAQDSYTDGNFILLGPSCGLLTHQNQTEFSWTPHKLATKYEVQIKFLGQQSYPVSTPADQIVSYNSTSGQPAKITLSKSLAYGDYTWRVTAKANVNGSEIVLQSTSDCNYQTWSL